jgi:nicotinamide riboside transporter PnuC
VAWEGIIGVFRGLFSALPDTVKKPINSIIGFINGMLQAVVNGVN